MVIYLDILILLNFIINYCFMKLIYLVFNEKVNKTRLIMSSLVSVFLLLSFFFDSIIYNIVRVFGGLILIIIAFKYSNKKRFVIMLSLFYLLQFSFIGVLSIYNIKGCSIFAFLLLICLLILIFSRKSNIYNNKTYKIIIKFKKEIIKIDGYLDTGNMASFNGVPIVFLKDDFFRNNLKQIGVVKIKTINNEQFINCYKPDKFYVLDNNKKIEKDVLIAFSSFDNNINCLLNCLMF